MLETDKKTKYKKKEKPVGQKRLNNFVASHFMWLKKNKMILELYYS